jgi:hypothetical protein
MTMTRGSGLSDRSCRSLAHRRHGRGVRPAHHRARKAARTVDRYGRASAGVDPTASRNASAGQRWLYFLSPWGMQFELVSFPKGKASGYGRELAAAGIREFCNLKTVWKA